MADRRIRLLVQAEVKRAINDLDKLEKQTDDNKQSANELTSTFKTLFGGAVLGAGARSIVQTASNFESLKVRLIALKGSTEEGAKAFDQFTKIAATTPFQVQNVVEAGATLEAFGVSSEDSLKSIADLAAFMGTDIVDASAAFGRAFAGGAGAADILRERGILQLIKDAEGIDDLSKLTLPKFREALERAMTDPDGKIAGATDLLAQTFSGKISNMQDSIDNLQNAIGSQFLGGLGDVAMKVGEVAREIGTFVENLSDDNLDDIKDFGLTIGTLAGAYGLLNISVMIGNAALGLFSKRVAVILVAFEAVNTVIKNLSLVQEKTLEARIAFNEFLLEQEQRTPRLIAGTTESIQASIDQFKGQLDEVKALNEGISFEKGVFASMLFGDDETIDAEKIKEDINSVKEEVNAATDEIIEKEKENQGTKKETEKIEKSAHQKRVEQNLESAIIQGQSAKQAGVSVIKAEVAKSTAALITKIMQNVPFPLNLAIAAGAGSMIGQVTDQLFSSFATGGSFITKGRTTLPIGNGVVVGDNASGMERIDVTPLPAPPTAERNITINISAPLVDETVVDTIIPAIRRAEKLNL
tara:strand:- start:5452 stop:7203 length:1752 start_codon:yes stop_codon:yes gene_type:complete